MTMKGTPETPWRCQKRSRSRTSFANSSLSMIAFARVGSRPTDFAADGRERLVDRGEADRTPRAGDVGDESDVEARLFHPHIVPRLTRDLRVAPRPRTRQPIPTRCELDPGARVTQEWQPWRKS